MAVGAVLTQNTNWANVKRAVRNLRRAGALSPQAIHRMAEAELARLIRPSGYYNVKARRLKHLVEFLISECGGRLRSLRRQDAQELRRRLLRVKGIGPETADSILLYALEKPVFVVDAYTLRVLKRHGLLSPQAGYQEAQELFHKALEPDARLFNEFHALFVRVGKEFCRPRRPLCGGCPLLSLGPPRST